MKGKTMEDLLILESVTKRFGGLTALNGVSLRVKQGEILGVIGPNGAGKTTLFNLISGFLVPNAGTITYKGKTLNGLRPDQICHIGISRTFQIPHLLNQLTVLQNVMIGAFIQDQSAAAVKEESLKLLESFHLKDKAQEITESLTYADCKRLEFARALATKPDLMLLDETMSGLTPVEAEEMMGIIQQLHDQGITFVIIEHVMHVIMKLCERINVLHHTTIICDGTPAEVTKDKAVIEAYLGEEFGA